VQTRSIIICVGVVLTSLAGVGIVEAIAAGPKPDATSAAATTTTTTTVPSTTIVETTIPATTVVQAVPPTVALVMTAEVVDGDTINMSDGSTVRLIGIDTPERGQCGYEESSAALFQLIVGQSITLVPGARDDVDRYGRLLRYVEANGVDLDLKMIESGHAIARYDGRDGYGVHPRQDAYVAADDLTPSTNACAATPVVVVPVAVVPLAVVPLAVVPLAVVPLAVVPVVTPPTAVYYQNCTEVRAAGAAPIHAGDPGWQTKFDRDGDGIGCE
jgi:endonuclease YncB( thermonuclease family)